MALPRKPFNVQEIKNNLIKTIENMDISYTDEISMTMSPSCGFGEVVIKKESGQVITERVGSSGKFRECTNCSSEMSREDRINLAKEMAKRRLPQVEIAKRLGVSQATVSLDLKR